MITYSFPSVISSNAVTFRGVCLSGAGPSIIALATNNFERIAQAICATLREAQDIQYDWQVLEVDPDGATCCDISD